MSSITANFKPDTGRKWGETNIRLALRHGVEWPNWLFNVEDLGTVDAYQRHRLPEHGAYLSLDLRTAPYEIKRVDEEDCPYHTIRRIHSFLNGLDESDYYFVRRGCVPTQEHEVDDLRTERGDWVENPFITPNPTISGHLVGTSKIKCDQCGAEGTFVSKIFTKRSQVSSRPLGMGALFPFDDSDVPEADYATDTGLLLAAQKILKGGHGKVCPTCYRGADNPHENGHLIQAENFSAISKEEAMEKIRSLLDSHFDWQIYSACHGRGVDFKFGGGLCVGNTVIYNSDWRAPVFRFQWRVWYQRNDDDTRKNCEFAGEGKGDQPELHYAGVYLDQLPLCQADHSGYISPHFETIGPLTCEEIYEAVVSRIDAKHFAKTIKKAVVEDVQDETLWCS